MAPPIDALVEVPSIEYLFRILNSKEYTGRLWALEETKQLNMRSIC